MNILSNYNVSVSAQKQDKDNSLVKKQNIKVNEKKQKSDVLDIFSEKIVNKKDVNDTVKVPRAIFKGYLFFTAGTALNSIAAMTDKGKLSKGLNIAGSILSVLGTFNFVKPYLIRNNELTKTEK